ncbi:uncharacterized protein LOC123869167 [Maniola jurtina]|uniref:uncharacterized protein LOC123869167 n=1 Tax=Maniola jurtina TaxID=191418 RepID=UPI001E68A94E|nr:uncharacterized protein LOC123869167 [Maniola jurtina]
MKQLWTDLYRVVGWCGARRAQGAIDGGPGARPDAGGRPTDARGRRACHTSSSRAAAPEPCSNVYLSEQLTDRWEAEEKRRECVAFCTYTECILSVRFFPVYLQYT